MSNSDQPESEMPSRASVGKATSELNNLIQIISGTSAALEGMLEGNEAAHEYFDALRGAVARAEQVAVDLAFQAGGSDERVLLQPEITPYARIKKAAPVMATKQTILVVDDEEVTLVLIERVLRDAGYDVVTANSAFDCLHLFRVHPDRFAMVLLDLSLPFIDGEETFRRIRDMRKNIPVLLCTGFIERERLSDMMLSGLSGFLRKPIAPDEIVRVVRSTLEGVRYNRDNPNATASAAG